MKSYGDYIKEENFDSFKVFKPKANANEPDPEYGIRAIVRYRIVLPKTGEKTTVISMFPPIQLRTTENKYEFNRHLNAHVASLKSQGYEVVGIHMDGDPIHARYAKGMKSK